MASLINQSDVQLSSNSTKDPSLGCRCVQPNNPTMEPEQVKKMDDSCALLCLIAGRLRPISMPVERKWVGDYEEHGKLNRECHRGKRT